jgi:hypothetical protein
MRERVRCSSLVDWPVYPRRLNYAGLVALAQSRVMTRRAFQIRNGGSAFRSVRRARGSVARAFPSQS